MEYLDVQLKIPNNLDISIKNELYNILVSLPYQNLQDISVTDQINYCFQILDINLALHIEQLFDKYINLHVKYSYLLFELGKDYPSSVRINKKGEKIHTKKQTKIICI